MSILGISYALSRFTLGLDVASSSGVGGCVEGPRQTAVLATLSAAAVLPHSTSNEQAFTAQCDNRKDELQCAEYQTGVVPDRPLVWVVYISLRREDHTCTTTTYTVL
ncbi:MAG: hypothetical protein FE78DRAFT_504521 [Acidomyces sp. 'richmondensis']|nr:MAG: hypothetical protein FE78DRAFT_504521 [Acidomyces sp. 'richmondensis']